MLKPYVSALVFALTSRNKGNYSSECRTFSTGNNPRRLRAKYTLHTSLRLVFRVFLTTDNLYTPAYSAISNARKVMSHALRIFDLQSCSNCSPAYGPHPLNSFS